jgi:hypothetical protein
LYVGEATEVATAVAADVGVSVEPRVMCAEVILGCGLTGQP